jgi:cystathionine beta-lyase/cystathionine gamma-synthase
VGVADGLIRVSVGIEGTDDLVADFEAGLATL